MKNERNKWKSLLGILAVAACILFGCKKKETVALADLTSLGNGQETSTQAQGEGEEEKEESGENTYPAMAADVALTEETAIERQEASVIIVHICGAVKNAGVYELPSGSRIYQAVEAAGGFSEEAQQDFLNQAGILQDGIRLYVPTKEEAEAAYGGEGMQDFITGGMETVGNPSEGEAFGLVNINTATEAELCTLSGIGSSKAKSIIAYRTEKGNFKSIEDIMSVEGIKDGLFQKIKDSITV